jgi:beta-phosphoglucomutase family hydrolase
MATIPAQIEAFLFDMDGVLTETARVHAAAWKQMFDAYLVERSERDGTEYAPFDADDDYNEYVDGKPRYDGVKSFLSARGIELPQGTPEDDPDEETIDGLGNRKNSLVMQMIRTEGVDPYPGSVRLMQAVREAGKRVAVVSSSANCGEIVAAAKLEGLLDVRVDGQTLAAEHLAGKPAPDAYLQAARELDTPPSQAAVFEDALSGVEAGRAGDFGLVVGVDRVGQAAALAEHGADIVVQDLTELLPYP